MKFKEFVEIGLLIYGQTQTLKSSKYNSERSNSEIQCPVKPIAIEAVSMKTYIRDEKKE